jgi:hypothetical protein
MPEAEWATDTYLKKLRGKSTERPAALYEVLLSRRKTVGADWPSHRDIACLFNGGRVCDKQPVAEIVSDDAGHLHDPLWGGGLNFKALTSEAHASFLSKVRKYRNNSELGRFKTHFQIGEVLTEPTLFCVIGKREADTRVFYLLDNEWRPLDEVATLKLNLTNSGAGGATPAEINKSLSALSRHVLWPAFFDNNPNEKFSLIGIYASTWQALGVWALHGIIKTDEVSPENSPCPTAPRLFRFAELTFGDLVGALFDRKLSRVERLQTATFCESLRTGASTPKQGDPIAEAAFNLVDADPVARLQQAFDLTLSNALSMVSATTSVQCADLRQLVALTTSSLYMRELGGYDSMCGWLDEVAIARLTALGPKSPLQTLLSSVGDIVSNKAKSSPDCIELSILLKFVKNFASAADDRRRRRQQQGT